MPVSPARQTAFRILLRLEAGRDYAVDLLQRAEVSALREADLHLATELVMGTLRWRGELDYRLQRLSGKRCEAFDPEVLTAFRLGLYQMGFLERIPRRAAVDESVELVKQARKRSAAGLVNAVLRKYAPGDVRSRARAGVANAEGLASARRTLPAWLAQSWDEQYGRESADALAWASTRLPLTTLRAVTVTRDEVAQRLKEEGVETRPGRFAPQALTVLSGNVRISSALREGALAIQDEASQLVAQLVAPRPGQRVLDLCAAPGIKTAQLAAALGRGLLVSADLSARRLGQMRKLWPRPTPEALKLQLLRLDATRQLPLRGDFDRVLVDAPCSGTGTLARNPEIKMRLRAEDVRRLSAMQTTILGHALGQVVAGGRLIYATCSLQLKENEAVVERVLATHPEFRLLEAPERAHEFPYLAPLFDPQGYFHTRPDRDQMDGFFAAVIVRTH